MNGSAYPDYDAVTRYFHPSREYLDLLGVYRRSPIVLRVAGTSRGVGKLTRRVSAGRILACFDTSMLQPYY